MVEEIKQEVEAEVVQIQYTHIQFYQMKNDKKDSLIYFYNRVKLLLLIKSQQIDTYLEPTLCQTLF